MTWSIQNKKVGKVRKEEKVGEVEKRGKGVISKTYILSIKWKLSKYKVTKYKVETIIYALYPFP